MFDLNSLSTEAKLLILNAQALVDETKITLKNKHLYLDLTSNMLLKSSCRDIERKIKEGFFEKAFEETLAPAYGDTVKPESVIFN